MGDEFEEDDHTKGMKTIVEILELPTTDTILNSIEREGIDEFHEAKGGANAAKEIADDQYALDMIE